MPASVRSGGFLRYLRPLRWSSRRRLASGREPVLRFRRMMFETASLDGTGYSGSPGFNVHPRARFFHPPAMLAYDGHEASPHHTPGGHLMAASLPVLSLFSGAGCLDLAVERCAEPFGANGTRTEGPFRVAVATDHDARALRSLQANFPRVPTICGDIRELSTCDFLDKAGVVKGEAELVVGGPPCTPFSKSGFWLEEKRSSSDPNASLLDEYARIVAEAQPRAFILENVQGLTYATHKAQLNRVLAQLTSAGYRPTYRVLMAADYGDPQLRRRVFVVGRRDGGGFRFPEPTHSGWSEHTRTFDPTKKPYVTAGSAIGPLLSGSSEPGD